MENQIQAGNVKLPFGIGIYTTNAGKNVFETNQEDYKIIYLVSTTNNKPNKQFKYGLKLHNNWSLAYTEQRILETAAEFKSLIDTFN